MQQVLPVRNLLRKIGSKPLVSTRLSDALHQGRLSLLKLFDETG
jgi:hypothetical protein